MGEYRCALHAPGGGGVILSRAARLRLATLSHALRGPDSITVPVGGTARFSCGVDSVPLARISWKKNGGPLPADSRYLTLPSGVLLIANVTSSDKGAYRCSAANNMLKKSRVSDDASLEIGLPSEKLKDRFLSQDRLIQIEQGENVSLECSVSGNYVPVWTFNSIYPTSSQTLYSPTLPGISILTLQNVNSNHSGSYTCTFNSSLQIFTQVITLQVLVPPTVLAPPQSQVYPTSRNARFNCKVEGYPPPIVVWYKDGIRVQPNGRVKVLDQEPLVPDGLEDDADGDKRPDQELLVSDSVAADTGYYQCMARNNVSESWGLAHLRIVPSTLKAPQNLVCQKHGENFIVLHWSAPSSGITAYIVHYQITGSTSAYKADLAITNSANVTGLKPFTNYTFTVRSYIKQGGSEPSPSVTCETGESVPDVAPQVSYSILSSTRLKVSWLPLESVQTYGHVTGYKVQWRNVVKTATKVKEVPANVLDFTIPDLIPGSRYEIRVLARTSRGWPVPSVEEKLDWLPVEMPFKASLEVPPAPTPPIVTHKNTIDAEEVILEAPTGLEAEPTSPHAINLTWSPPLLVACKYYSVVVREVHSSHGLEEPRNISCANPWKEIDGLRPNTVYELMLKVHNSFGQNSHFSEKIECQTLEDAPQIVTDVSWEPLNATTIKVMWKEFGSPITQFNVSLVPLGYFLVNGSHTSTEIPGMKPSIPYQLTVSGISRGGIGQPSETQMVLIPSPEVVNPTGQQVAGESSDYSLMFGVTSSIVVAVVLLLALVFLNMYRSFRRRGPVNSTTTATQNPFQLNGHGLHVQVPLTSLVSSDPSLYRHHLGIRQVDTESHDGSDSKGAEESDINLLPGGIVPAPIGASSLHPNDHGNTVDALRTSPSWSGTLLPRHMFHITENPQFDVKSQPLKYCPDSSKQENSEEMVTLLPGKQHKFCESDMEDDCDCAEDEDEAIGDSLNVTQVTDVDHSFQDKSNNNNTTHNSNVSTISSHSGISDGCQSSRSNSFLEETSESSNDLTEQQLLVTLSSVPLHHLTTKPFTDVPKVSVVGPNG